MRQKSRLIETVEHEIRELMDELDKERAEIELKIYLAKAEARDEWEQAEKKWQELRGKADLLGGEVKEASRDVGKAARALAQELKRSYIRIHRQLKQL